MSNTSGSGNTAIGASSLIANTVGNYNTATGGLAMPLNTSGSGNTASGYGTLYNNSTGNYNTTSGYIHSKLTLQEVITLESATKHSKQIMRITTLLSAHHQFHHPPLAAKTQPLATLRFTATLQEAKILPAVTGTS